MEQNDYIYVPFPRELYDKVVIRSEGKIDPVYLAIYKLEEWIENTLHDLQEWTEEGFKEWQAELDQSSSGPSLGDPLKGYQWKELFLPNGSDLRMTYQSKNHYAQIRHEKVMYEGAAYSPSQLASKIADNTSRSAWRDLWVKFPGESNWHLGSELRRRQKREARS